MFYFERKFQLVSVSCRIYIFSCFFISYIFSPSYLIFPVGKVITSTIRNLLKNIVLKYNSTMEYFSTTSVLFRSDSFILYLICHLNLLYLLFNLKSRFCQCCLLHTKYFFMVSGFSGDIISLTIF